VMCVGWILILEMHGTNIKKKACVLIHPLVLQRQSPGSKPSSHADSFCYSLFNESFAVTLPADKSLIMSNTVCQMTVVTLL